MAIQLDSGGMRWWRPRSEWHLGWAAEELEWLRQGRPAPEMWDYHRLGTRWADITYAQARECWEAGHPNTAIYMWKSERSGYRWANETCEDCGEKIGGAIGTRRLQTLGLDRSALPIANASVESVEVCARCGGGDYLELHHWAPRHLFTDCDEWPQDYLCRECHAQWHAIVTPAMNARRSA